MAGNYDDNSDLVRKIFLMYNYVARKFCTFGGMGVPGWSSSIFLVWLCPSLFAVPLSLGFRRLIRYLAFGSFFLERTHPITAMGI